MNIFELAELDDGAASYLVARTLGLHPALRQLYEEVFLRRLIRRRRENNFLLLLLVRPDDDYANAFWSALVADLETLQAEGAWATYRGRLRRHERFDFESARSEIALAAWMKRRSVPITLEPPTRDGRVCEFMAMTLPPTWWEMKAIHDLDFIVADEVVAFEVQRRLRRLNEPYMLTLRESNLERKSIISAVRDIKRHIAAFHRSGGVPPATFESQGLVVEVASTTKRSQGYLGVSTSSHCWQDEYAVKVGDRIASAAQQLPEDGAGIVVIDTTMSTWIHREDIIDACFGVESAAVARGRWYNIRDERGAFKPGQRRRISAVLHYSRTPCDSESGLAVIHNPFARTALPDRLFDGEEQIRRVSNPDGTFRLEKS